nr:unnamed protein product [Callosobruchus chinensis]
MEATLL